MLKLIPFRRKELFGYFDLKKNIMTIPVQYETAGFFKDGLATVSNEENMWGIINERGEEVIPLEHSLLGDYFSEGLIEFAKDGAYGFLDKNNNIIIEAKFGYVLAFNEGLAGFKAKNNLWGFIDKSGSVVIEPKYDWVFNFKDGYAKTQLNTWETYISSDGLELYES